MNYQPPNKPSKRYTIDTMPNDAAVWHKKRQDALQAARDRKLGAIWCAVDGVIVCGYSANG